MTDGMPNPYSSGYYLQYRDGTYSNDWVRYPTQQEIDLVKDYTEQWPYDYSGPEFRSASSNKWKYAAMAAGAAVTVGLGMASWQATPKDERSKAAQIAVPEGRKMKSRPIRPR